MGSFWAGTSLSRICCERERLGQYSNERSEASAETARENARLTRVTREDHVYGVSRIPNREEKTTVREDSSLLIFVPWETIDLSLLHARCF